MSKNVLAVNMECTSKHGRAERIVIIGVYMTVEGERGRIQGKLQNSKEYCERAW